MTIIDELYWIIPDQLAGMPKPGQEEITLLYEAGIRAVVSFLEKKQLDSIMMYDQLGTEFLHIPIEDFWIPTKPQVMRFIEFVDSMRKANKPVAAHCFGGRGRTGTMLAAYLIFHGDKSDVAIQKIRAKQPRAIESTAQLEFLKNLKF